MTQRSPKQEVWFDKLSFSQAVKSLEEVALQLCHARDDTYHRARAEAKNEAYEFVIKMWIKESLESVKNENP